VIRSYFSEKGSSSAAATAAIAAACNDGLEDKAASGHTSS